MNLIAFRSHLSYKNTQVYPVKLHECWLRNELRAFSKSQSDMITKAVTTTLNREFGTRETALENVIHQVNLNSGDIGACRKQY